MSSSPRQSMRKNSQNDAMISYPYEETFSPQAIIQTVVLGILSIIYAYGVVVNYSASQLIFFIVWLLIAAIAIYDTQCLATSKCNAWSWIRTILLCILPVIIIVNYFTTLHIWKKQEEERQKQ